MMDQLSHWWLARTSRERLLLMTCAVLIFGVAAPLLALQASGGYRNDARAALGAAEDVARDVAKVSAMRSRQGAAALPGDDGTLRGLAVSAAESQGLSFARIEPAGPERLRVTFAPSPSPAVYRWLALIAGRGVVVSKTSIVREGDALVIADFEIARS